MKEKLPSIQEWKDLYRAAIKFKKLKPWEWMWDSDIFGVKNPATGEIGYCCVMGRAGEHFALGVYLGTDGLEGLLKIQSGEIVPGDEEGLFLQKCLMASFEDRKIIDKQDYEVIRILGLRFRGQNAWPLFRSYLPGHLPWYLNRGEAKFLTVVLQQAIHVCKRFRKDPEMLDSPLPGQFLVKVPEDGSRWSDQWLEPMDLEEEEVPVGTVDDDALEDLRKLKHQGVWEADFFYFHEAVQDDPEERPYYPYVILWAEGDNGIILSSEVVGHEQWLAVFVEQFQENIENTKSLPTEVIVKKEELFTFLEGVTSKLGIKLTLTTDLKVIDQARKQMQDFPMDEDEMFKAVIELLMEDESFRALMEDKSLEDLMKKGSIQDLLEDESIQSLIEEKRRERANAQIKENGHDPGQTTLFDDINSNQDEREYVDKDRKVMDDYHKLIQEEPGISLLNVELKMELEKLIKKDPDFFDSYLTLFQILESEGRPSEAMKVLDEAYKRAINLITDKKGEWPDLLEWGWLENRHIIRTILNKAISLWKAGKTDDALDLFRKLLKSNPDDNIGARNYILAIRMKMSFKKFEKRFNRGGFYNSRLMDWFEENYKKFPDDFDWWDEAMEKYE